MNWRLAKRCNCEGMREVRMQVTSEAFQHEVSFRFRIRLWDVLYGHVSLWDDSETETFPLENGKNNSHNS